MMWVIVLLLLNSLFAVAQVDSSSVDSSSCNWWCRVKAVFGGNVVGKGQDTPSVTCDNTCKKKIFNAFKDSNKYGEYGEQKLKGKLTAAGFNPDDFVYRVGTDNDWYASAKVDKASVVNKQLSEIGVATGVATLGTSVDVLAPTKKIVADQFSNYAQVSHIDKTQLEYELAAAGVSGLFEITSIPDGFIAKPKTGKVSEISTTLHPQQNEIGKPIVNPYGLKDGDVIKNAGGDMFEVEGVDTDGTIFNHEGDEIGPKDANYFTLVSTTQLSTTPIPTPSPTAVKNPQLSTVSSTPTAGKLTPAQKNLISTFKTTDEVVETLEKNGISNDKTITFVRDNSGNLLVTKNGKTTIYNDKGIVVTPTATPSPTPEPTPTPTPTAVKNPVAGTLVKEGNQLTAIYLNNKDTVKKGDTIHNRNSGLDYIVAGFSKEGEILLIDKSKYDNTKQYNKNDPFVTYIIPNNFGYLAPLPNPQPTPKPAGVPNNAVKTADESYWVVPPGDGCSDAEMNRCGAVYTKEGVLVKGIVYAGGNTYYNAPKPDWTGDQEISGLPGNSELSIEDGKLVLDCGTICVDEPLRVNPSSGDIEGWTSDGWKPLSKEAIEAIPDVQAKRDLVASQEKFKQIINPKTTTTMVVVATPSSEKTITTQITEKQDDVIQKLTTAKTTAEKELNKLEQDKDTTLAAFAKSLGSISVEDRDKAIADKQKKLEAKIEEQKDKVESLEDEIKTQEDTKGDQLKKASDLDKIQTEINEKNKDIEYYNDLLTKDLAEETKASYLNKLKNLKEEKKSKEEDLKEGLTELGLQGTAGSDQKTQPQKAEIKGKIYNQIDEVQNALAAKAITHGEAYDAMKIIADKSEKEYQTAKAAYDTKIQNFKNNIGSDGKIKSEIIGSSLYDIADQLEIETREFKPINSEDLKPGDRITFKLPDERSASYTVDYINGDLIYSKDLSTEPAVISGKDIRNLERLTILDEATVRQKINDDIAAGKKSVDDKGAKSNGEKEAADSMRWQGTWWDVVDNSPAYKAMKDVGSILTGGFEAVGSLGSYRALSNLLFPDTTKEWSSWANDETLARWADLPNFAAAKACGQDDAKRANQPGQSAAFITTTAGTFQAVGSIQAEKSPTKFPILCTKNKEDQWVCPKDPKDPSKNLVCKDNTYCYKDKNAEKPEEGYFYKITWGVTAPSDEKFTPYVDEDGVAVKFNVYLDKIIPLYNKKGITEKKQVLQLTNGGHDGGMIVRYLPTNYNSVCILFDKPIKDIGSDDINEICSTIIPSTGGVVEYASSSKAETVTSTSADVELDI